LKSNYWIQQKYSLHYYSAGNPENFCLVLLHGFMGSGIDWQVITENLSQNYYCLMPDLPGHGLTTISGSNDLYQMESAASILIQFLRDKNILKSSLLGYSMGGRLALYLLAEYPGMWQNLILESSTPGIDSEEERLSRNKNDEDLAKKIENGDFEIFLQNWYQQPLFKSLQGKPYMEELISRRKHNNTATLALSLKMMGTGRQPSLWEDLPKMNIPILLLAGEFDLKFSTLMTRMEKILPHAELKVINEAGHNTHLEQPLVYSEYIFNFLKEFGRETHE